MWSDERWKVARRCGAKCLAKSKCTKHLSFGALLEVAMSSRCGAERISKSKRRNHIRFGELFEVEMSKKVHAVVTRSTFPSQTHCVQPPFGSRDAEKVHAAVARSICRSQKCKRLRGIRSTFGRSDVVSRGRRTGLCTLSKVSKTWGFCSSFKNDGRRGTYAEDLARCISRGRRSTRDMFIRAVRRSGRWFPERGCILEHQIFSLSEKVGKSHNTVFFHWFEAPEGPKVGSLKRRVRSHLARWEMKNCTPLWREAHFEIKMNKKLLEVAMSKKCTPLWREAHFQVKMNKTHHSQTTFGSWDVEKVLAVVARSTFRSQHFIKKTLGVRTTFGGSDVLSRGRHKGLWILSKGSKTWGFCSSSKNDGRRGTFEEDLARCIFRGRGSTRDMFIRAVRRSGRWFPERGCILEHQIFSFGKMILRGRCSTAYKVGPAS